MRENRLRSLWAADRAALNGWLAIANSFSAEVMAHQGWDTLTIDLQHGVIDYAQMVTMLQAISTTATVPIVRVPWLEAGAIMKALDAGAYGVICPMVNTRDDAARLVSWVRYAPQGTRSFGPIRAGYYGGADYAQQANSTVVAFAMIETAQALDNLDAILSVEGLDAIYIGPSDLSLSLGCRPVFDDVDAPVAQAIAHIAERAKAHGVQCGIHNGVPAVAQARQALGYRFLTLGSDARFLAQADVGLYRENLTLNGGVHVSRTRYVDSEQLAGFANASFLHIVEALHFDTGLFAQTGSLIRSAALSLGAGTLLAAESLDLAINYRPALTRYYADTSAFLEHSASASAIWQIDATLRLGVSADVIAGRDLSVLLMQSSLQWRPDARSSL